MQLAMDEIRVVARFAADAAEEALPVFERAHPDDGRPRDAIAAARAFTDGAPRGRVQRAASTAAHSAARGAASEAARLAAQAAGDAAAAAYLHPIAESHQVGHILRAAANAACVAELEAAGDPSAALAALDRALARATTVLVDVLRRYPPPSKRGARTAQLVAELDARLRSWVEP